LEKLIGGGTIDNLTIVTSNFLLVYGGLIVEKISNKLFVLVLMVLLFS